MVGGSLASSLAYALKIPAIPVHHLGGHILACMLEEPAPEFPFLALMVSGGHSQLVEVLGLGRYRIVGETLDDAAGEAFDKVARLLGLPYPGGPELAALAERRRGASPCRGRSRTRASTSSFSGLKTAARLAIDACRAADGSLPEVGARRRRRVVSGGRRRHADGKCRQALEATSLTRSRRRRRCRREPGAALEPRGSRPPSRRARVLSEAGAVHGQRRHDRLRRVVPARGGRE